MLSPLVTIQPLPAFNVIPVYISNMVKTFIAVHKRFGRPSWPVSLAVVVFLGLSGIAVTAGFTKVLAISWTAAGAMISGTVLGASLGRDIVPGEVVWGYGLASGAMIASDAVFIVPRAIRFAPQVGGLGSPQA